MYKDSQIQALNCFSGFQRIPSSSGISLKETIQISRFRNGNYFFIYYWTHMSKKTCVPAGECPQHPRFVCECVFMPIFHCSVTNEQGMFDPNSTDYSTIVPDTDQMNMNVWIGRKKWIISVLARFSGVLTNLKQERFGLI